MSAVISKSVVRQDSGIITRREQLNLSGKPFLLEHVNSGKIRENFIRDNDALLMVTTDRRSALDVIMNEGFGGTGRILNNISLLNFKLTEEIIPNHIITADMTDAFPGSKDYLHLLNGRAVVVKKAEPIRFECVVRGYLYGTGLKDYERNNGVVCGIQLPSGLIKASKFEQPIFTPSTKADTGHDQNVTFEQMVSSLNVSLAWQMKEVSIALYKRIAEYAFERGLILADTKFEFGIVKGRVILIDEAGTPDSSRYWYLNQYKPGQDQPSVDKQPLRDYLESLVRNNVWDGKPPAPALPREVIAETSARYANAYTLLEGKPPRTVSIIMGSESDMVVAQKAEAVLEPLGVWFERNVLSAHRNPRSLDKYLSESNADVYIAIAGLSAALPGVVAARTRKPVIGVPVSRDADLDLTPLLSIVEMPPGVPVATVGQNNGKNAGILAAQILGVSDSGLDRKLAETFRKED